MAILSEEEKLIQKAATGKDAFLHKIYKRLYLHFKAESSTGKKIYDDCFYIDFLYQQSHEEKTFANIADEVFHIGLSTLEDRREIYVKIFYFYLKNEKEESEAAYNTDIAL